MQDRLLFAKISVFFLAVALVSNACLAAQPKAFFAEECSAEDISNFVSGDTHFLETGETIGNIIAIRQKEEVYCVVQIVLRSKTSGYIALKGAEKQAITDETLNKRLFQTTEFIVQYQQFKKEIKDKAMTWFIVKWNDASTIATKISGETLDLDLIRGELDNSEAYAIVSELEAKLAQISIALEVLKNKMSATDSLESSFVTKPLVGGETGLKDAVTECYSYIAQLHQLNLEYSELQKKLRVEIAGDPDLSMEAKQQLNQAAELPEEFSRIEQWYQSAENMSLEKTMNTIFLNASGSSAEFAKEVTAMLQRDVAFKALYSEDPDFKKKTDGNFASLKEAFDKMNGEQIKEFWADQEKLSQFSAEWAAAEDKFQRRDYERALENAKNAKKSALAVYSAGLLEPEPEGINYELLISVAVIIIFVLIILYMIKNRGKLVSFVSGSGEEEEVVFDGIR
ncbi:MAG: hypothetical protein V1493_05115 [Candidatus Diapherotrites archaeon]